MSKIKLKMMIGVKRILSVFLTLMLVQVGVPFTRFTASAKTLSVYGGTSDDLQKEINSAQDGDTIEIVGIINMTGTVTIKKNITLSGNGYLVRNAQNTGALIKIESGKVTMKDIRIDGKKIEADDAAVSVGNNCEFTMESGEIINNYNYYEVRRDSQGKKRKFPGGHGGGIYSYAGTVTMNGGIIKGNKSNCDGGGIYKEYGTVTMNGGTISGNTATKGGGIYNWNGTVTISGGEISGNTAEDEGGGIYSYGTVNLNGGTISGNTSNYGGSICSYVGTVTMNGGTISGNTGRGIYCGSSGSVTMSGGTISGNTGCGVDGGKAITMSGGEISGNSGGGVYCSGTLKVKGAPKIIDNGESKNNNVNQCITIEGEFTGLIGVKRAFDQAAVIPEVGYTITRDDLSHFKADSEDAHLSLVGNNILYVKNKTEWGKVVQIDGVTYYVNENGRASAEIIGNAETWLNTKIDGSGSWCGIDNSKGVFKTGSRFYFHVINDANVGKYYDRIGKDYREKIENGKLKIFLIGVIDPDGNEYTTLDSDLTCYVKIDPNWDKSKLRAIFINGKKTEDVKVNCVGLKKGSANDGWYAQLVLKHFSPYAIYQAKSNEAEVAQVNSNNISVANNFATGESTEYVYILGLWAASVIALAGIVVAKRKFNK